MDNKNENSAIGNLGAAFELALKQREFEISQLTQRNNFFMIFQGVLIAGLVQSQGSAAAIISFSVCSVGLLISIFQIQMAAGSKYWQMRWERASRTLELWLLEALKEHPHVTQFFTVDGRHLSEDEKDRLTKVNEAKGRALDQLTMDDDAIREANRKDLATSNSLMRSLILSKPSVSRIPIYAGISLAVFWAVLLSFTFEINGFPPLSCFPSLIKLTPFKL